YFLTLADSVTDVYLTSDQARARFTAAGVPLDKPVVVYCHIGQTASVDYVQLRRLGVPVRLYDGSFEDWSRTATIQSCPAQISSRIRAIRPSPRSTFQHGCLSGAIRGSRPRFLSYLRRAP